MSLDFGFSKALMIRWASGAANTILLTSRGYGTTTARELWTKMVDRDRAAADRATAKVAAARARAGGRMAGGMGVGVGVGVDDEEEEEEGEASLFVGVKVRGGEAQEGGGGGGKGRWGGVGSMLHAHGVLFAASPESLNRRMRVAWPQVDQRVRWVLSSRV